MATVELVQGVYEEMESWSDVMDWLVDVDGCSEDEAEGLIDLAQMENEFGD